MAALRQTYQGHDGVLALEPARDAAGLRARLHVADGPIGAYLRVRRSA
jgi:hypothetical protein